MKASVILKKGQGRTLKSGGPWVYDNEIDRVENSPADGDIVDILDFDGYYLGQGYINSRSTIRIRIMSRDRDAVIDRDFLKQRVRNAWDYRKKVIDTGACRVVFAEADFLPGLVIDKFGTVLVMCFDTLYMDIHRQEIVDITLEVMKEDGIQITGVFNRSDSKVRRHEGLDLVKGFLTEPFDTQVPITENGVRYRVDVKDGQKTGFFLDQKINRTLIHGVSRGADVLDCFTHTGSFALNAAVHGASRVLGLDASQLAIDRATENARLNGVEDRVTFRVADVLDALPAFNAEGRKYDLVILDPPAFTKSRNSIKHAEKGYREINIQGMKLVKDGGYLATCTCSHFMSQENFARILAQAARSAHKRLRQVSFSTQAPDHPILWATEESYYLKFYVFQVVEEM